MTEFRGKDQNTLSQERRDRVANGDFQWKKSSEALACYMGVWDEGLWGVTDPDRRNRELTEEIVETPRRDFCFFWQYRPGMMFSAAKTLQEKQANARENTRDRWYTRLGLYIAAGALAVDVLLRILLIVTLWLTSSENG